MNLYELNSNYQQLMELVESGMVDIEDAIDTLDGIDQEFDIKADQIACWIKDLVADANAIKSEISALKERMDSKLKKAESLEYYLMETMKTADKKKIESARCVIKLQDYESVNILDIEELFREVPDMVDVKTEYKPNKTEIKKLIKGGASVPGCEIISTTHINIK